MSSRRVKMPSFQFYPGDWLRDAGLRACTVASRGVWMDLLCYMHDSPVRGLLLKSNGQPFTEGELSRALGLSTAALRRHLTELESAGVFDKNADGVIVSRRMAADEEARQQASDNGRKGGNPELLKGKPQGLPEVAKPGQPAANGVDKPAHKPGDNPPVKGVVGDGISLSSSSSSSSDSLCGETPPGEKTTSETTKTPPAKKAAKSSDKPREPNPLFDAIAEVTGLDPATAGALIGSVAASLSKAEKPYGPADVREFARRFHELCPHAAKDTPPRLRPTAKEIERYIGLIRASPPPVAPTTRDPRVIYD
jgi:DNA-binding transcriptional ArsR family regulator